MERSKDMWIAVVTILVAILLLSIAIVYIRISDLHEKRLITGKERTRTDCVQQCKLKGYTESSCEADPWRFCFRDGTNP